MLTKNVAAAAAAAVALAGGTVVLSGAASPYTATVVLDSATNVVEGGPVMVNGFEAGTVEDLRVEGGKAVVEFSLDDEYAPLHDGAEAVVGWKATLSERRLEITDGPEANPEVPSGGMLEGTMPAPVELDDVLNSLDDDTRASMASMVQRLAATLEGEEEETRATLTEVGPMLEAFGQLFRALGTDGPAIENLVTRLDAMLGVLGERDAEVERIIGQLTDMSREFVTRRTQIRETVRALPGTLAQAQRLVDQLPGVVEEAGPLLEDLRPATARLRPVAEDLAPLLQDLRPATADLRPALAAAQTLLGRTPALFEMTDQTLPGLTGLSEESEEIAAFTRPYTPEVIGFFSTWASAFSNYDSNGYFARIQGQQGTTSFNENPGVVPPGVAYDPYPLPGAVVGQPWTDAYGSEMR